MEKIAISNPETFIGDVNSEEKLSALEEIAHKLLENPSEYKVSVEHVDDGQSLIVIRVSNYRKRKNLHENTFSNIRATEKFLARRDSPEELKSNYHAIHIKVPYKFISNATLDEGETQEKQAHKDAQNTFDANMQRLHDDEEKSKFRKLPEKYIQNEHGYLYRIQINDINGQLPFTNNITNNREMRRKKIENSETEGGEHKDDNAGKKRATPTIRNSSCFGMISRQLLHNASYKTLYDVSLEQCRCACGRTWNEDGCVTKCKSFQYSNTTRKCLLNEDDHNGKFDLVYNWDTNYFYRICVVRDIVKDALRNCPASGKAKFKEIALREANANLDSAISNDEVNEIIHSIRKRSTTDHQSSPIFRAKSVYWWKKSGRNEVSNKTVTEEVILSPGLWSKLLRRKGAARNLKSLVLGIVKKESEEIKVGDVKKSGGTSDGYNNNNSLNESDVTAVTPINEADEMTISEEFEIHGTDFEDVSKIEQNSTTKTKEKCFEVIDGFLLRGTAGGLEQEVTLEECQCYCANSRSKGRYSFQCVSATYYHEERDCVLNLQTRNSFPKQFKRQDNVSYLGMICSVEVSKQQLVNNNLTDGCREIVSISTPTTKSEELFAPVHTDSCFIEMPNHVLYGTAFGAETNISVEACKCYCMNAERQYGIECRSIQYYFDSGTCLLNNEFSMYIKEKCLFAMELKSTNSNSPSNILNEIDSKRNAIAHSNEVTNIGKYNDIIDFTDSSMISTRNSIYSSEYATSSTTLNGILHESGKKEDEDSEEMNESEDVHLSTTTYATTATSALENFTNSVTTADPFLEANNMTVATALPKIDYDTSNQKFETTPTIEIATYPHLGRCVYSAIYQTSFRGTKLIKRFLVSSPQQCFHGCHFEGCRSSNLIQVDNQTYSCELFSDALIDYRTSDVLVYDRGSVYFDGIECSARHRKVNDSSSRENDNSIDNENYDDSN
ncbi:unnamed protein product [Litomosoides sigmodontis]|uniref:Apple domain-containing protein n=1 Tax=Litomosoides sigmodontis TaxID=42156 RepID=A0A3P6USV6_LITSI|nr:unnamed protein product [Litomosoides sigmodontis]